MFNTCISRRRLAEDFNLPSQSLFLHRLAHSFHRVYQLRQVRIDRLQQFRVFLLRSLNVLVHLIDPSAKNHVEGDVLPLQSERFGISIVSAVMADVAGDVGRESL